MAFQFHLNNADQGFLVVEDTPLNWQALKKKWKRSEELDGITRTFSQDVEFRGDGAEYLRAVREAQGIDATVTVQVFEYVPDLFAYELLYSGLINFENYSLKTKDNFTVVETNFYEEGFDQNFLSNLDTVVNLQRLTTRTGQAIIPYTNETETVPLHSLLLSRVYEAETVTDTFTQYFQLGKKFDEDFNHFFYVPIGLDNVIRDQIVDTFTYPLTISEIDPVEVLKAVHRLTEAGSYTFDIALNYSLLMEGEAGNDEITGTRIEVVFSVNGTETILDTQTFSGRVQTYTLNNIAASLVGLTINLQPEDRVYFFVRCEFDFDASGGVTDDKFELGNFTFTVNSCTFQTSAITEFPETDCQGVLMYEAFNRIVESITDVPNSIRSDFFGRTDSEPLTYPADGEGSLELLTNGYQIRQFPLVDVGNVVGRPIFANFRDLFQTQNVKFNLGAGIIQEGNDRVLRIEEKAFFWQEVVVLELGCVRNFTESIDPQSHYNRIKIGYESFGAEDRDVDGLDEFNSLREYTTDLQRVSNDLDLVAPYGASGYRTEFKRRLPFSEEDLEESKGDAENYVINVRRDGGDFITDRDEDFSVVTGVTDPASAYNLKATPARALRRWGNIIAIGLEKLTNKIVRFASGEANYGLETQLNSETSTISEQQDFDADVDFEPPLYRPDIYEFEHPLNREQAKLIDANPYGIIQFFDNENSRRQGFILDVDWTVRDKEAKFKLQRVRELINP